MKVGDTIELVFTDDPWTDLTPGTRGKITYLGSESMYGDPDQVGVAWENGSTLGLLITRDRFRVIEA